MPPLSPLTYSLLFAEEQNRFASNSIIVGKGLDVLSGTTPISVSFFDPSCGTFVDKTIPGFKQYYLKITEDPHENLVSYYIVNYFNSCLIDFDEGYSPYKFSFIKNPINKAILVSALSLFSDNCGTVYREYMDHENQIRSDLSLEFSKV